MTNYYLIQKKLTNTLITELSCSGTSLQIETKPVRAELHSSDEY